MQILLYFVVVLHVIVCLFLIGVVLLQQGRSADLAGAFGGQGSQTAFGPRAAANVLTRLTTWSAVIFMLTSISLTVLYVRSTGSHSVLEKRRQASAPASPAPAKSAKLSNHRIHFRRTSTDGRPNGLPFAFAALLQLFPPVSKIFLDRYIFQIYLLAI